MMVICMPSHPEQALYACAFERKIELRPPFAPPSSGNDPFARARGIIEQDNSSRRNGPEQALGDSSSIGMDRPRWTVDDKEVDYWRDIDQIVPQPRPSRVALGERCVEKVSGQAMLRQPVAHFDDKRVMLVVAVEV